MDPSYTEVGLRSSITFWRDAGWEAGQQQRGKEPKSKEQNGSARQERKRGRRESAYAASIAMQQ